MVMEVARQKPDQVEAVLSGYSMSGTLGDMSLFTGRATGISGSYNIDKWGFLIAPIPNGGGTTVSDIYGTPQIGIGKSITVMEPFRYR
jgi:hypothetical protein